MKKKVSSYYIKDLIIQASIDLGCDFDIFSYLLYMLDGLDLGILYT
jgi:hypothetical protein